MNSTRKNHIIYLLGAGRSGTTLLATLLHAHPAVFTLGEMLQFFEHLQAKKPCSCGEKLQQCPVWQPIVQTLAFKPGEIDTALAITKAVEKHRKIPREWCTQKTNETYTRVHEKVFREVQKKHPRQWLLDSSKYIARYLALKKNPSNHIKGVYLVRDVRGVVHSFQKNVQTPKKPFSAILYYNLINFWGQLVAHFDKNVIKIRYEDLIETPEESLAKIYRHVFEKEPGEIQLPDDFKMPHIIGGNRMKAKKKISLSKDKAWQKNFTKTQQIAYYILSCPFMWLNRYHP